MILFSHQGSRGVPLWVASTIFVGLISIAAPTSAGLTIVPTFDISITSKSNAAAIEGTINAAISDYQASFTDNITIAIDFKDMSTGLGQSSTPVYLTSYSGYSAALVADATTTDDATALATLPNSLNNPVDGGRNLYVSRANRLAVGIATGSTSDGFDGTISLNSTITNVDRTATNPSKFDLKSVVQHEIDEVLGLGSSLATNLSAPRPEDLFRYSALGALSYTTNTSATSYFSIDGGMTSLVAFNQSGGGSDYGDWLNSATLRVQDAFGTTGATPNLGVELRALDVIGYNLAPRNNAVPEPSTLSLLGVGASILSGYQVIRRRQSKSA